MTSTRLRMPGVVAALVTTVAGVASLAGGAAISATPVSRLSFSGARPAPDGNREPEHLAFSRDGKTVYVTEAAEGTVAVVDAASFAVRAHLKSGGERPEGLAVTPDGSRLVVANSFGAAVGLIDVPSGKLTTIPLSGMPYGVAIAPDGKRAYVSVSQMDQVAVLALPSGRIVERIDVGHRPRALALSADGAKLVVANLAGGTISVVSTASNKEEAQVPLKGVNVRGVAITADGTEAYATCMPAFNGKPADDPREIWHNFVQSVTLDGADSTQGEDQWMDFARVPREVDVIGSPDQHDLVMDTHARYAWIAVTGRDVVTRITIHDRNRNTIWPFSQQETPVGAAPKGLALSPDEKQVWVTNTLGDSLSVLDAASGSVLKTIDLGKASRIDPTIAGQYLFQNAGLTRYRRFTCASCHPDGGADGLTWRFVHVKDGVEKRNSRDLRAGLADTAPYRWSGLEPHLEGFLKEEVPGLLGGPVPSDEQARALAAAISAFRLPPNPYRLADGSHTPEALRGRTLFEGKAGCVGCHAGPKAGGTGIKAWIGTTPSSLRIDVPHLAGVYDSAPYLHDGRAATLEEIFEPYNPHGSHGSMDRLTPDERRDLLRYVREL